MKYKSENEIMKDWVEDINLIPETEEKTRIIERINYLYLGKITTFRLKGFLEY